MSNGDEVFVDCQEEARMGDGAFWVWLWFILVLGEIERGERRRRRNRVWLEDGSLGSVMGGVRRDEWNRAAIGRSTTCGVEAGGGDD